MEPRRKEMVDAARGVFGILPRDDWLTGMVWRGCFCAFSRCWIRSASASVGLVDMVLEERCKEPIFIYSHRKIKNFGMPENRTEIISFRNSAETNNFSIPENSDGQPKSIPKLLVSATCLKLMVSD
jgi:hypothetical protein